jgi:hypothetical protein
MNRVLTLEPFVSRQGGSTELTRFLSTSRGKMLTLEASSQKLLYEAKEHGHNADESQS